MIPDTGLRKAERGGGLAEITDLCFEPAAVGTDLIVGFTMFRMPTKMHMTRAQGARALESLTKALAVSLSGIRNPQSEIAP